MSCTENESGPFVVFFLPAVVGCLTILLARRWANTQVNNTSSTAVSRRRKIIKDPLVKRPLPPIACKMVQPASKKTPSVNKKGSTYPEEEQNGHSKKNGRPKVSQNPLNTHTAETKVSDGLQPPKHIPFPYIPQDGELLFETMTFMFVMVATGLQFLNIYRTNWWLPNSYINQAMHFYLIDPHLVAFIVAISVRSLLLSLTLAVLRYFVAPKLMAHATIAARMFILGVILGALSWCTYFMMLKYPLIKIFYLCYPAVIYFLLFGFQSGPFLELNNTEQPLLHSCSYEPEQIRAEVETLRQDFNLRVKKILFNAVVGAYYSSFIPCCFAQAWVRYDVYASCTQVAWACGALGGRLAAQLLSASANDAPHRAALHLGGWARDAGPASAPAPAWAPQLLHPPGARVAHLGRVYCAAGLTAATPGDQAHQRFYAVFSNPSTLICLFLCLQLALIVLKVCLLFSPLQWHHFLAIVILLFINYYSLFKMLRDYLVAWRVYKAESIIQDKNNHSAVNS